MQPNPQKIETQLVSLTVVYLLFLILFILGISIICIILSIQIITMIFMHPQSLQHQISEHAMRQRFRQPFQEYPINGGSQMRKKIQNYSFLLSEQIGKGYSSKVYKGLDDDTRQQVAIKVIELKSLRDHTSRTMLHTQIQCFKEVNHPNVLKYLNSFFTANNCYIITEYCPGGDLSKLMKKKGKLTQKQASGIFLQIFEAYKAFYDAGYVHRDIKPANIFVGKDGGMRLADFGFSKKRTLVDRENYNVGTPIYMPRQSLAANIYNEKTDLWALGITLYEMIYGEVPFKGLTEHQLRKNIETGILRFPQTAQVSQNLKDFIAKTLLNDSMSRMGVKEMQKHPWLSQFFRKEVKSGTQSLQEIKQEDDLRTSLPQNGCLHHKSRDYFDNKENRRSSSATQKLKICMPRKGSQIISKHKEPLGERSFNHNDKPFCELDNKENKNINRESTSINKSIRDNITKESPQNKPSASVGIQKIVSLINYFRLLYRLLDKLQQASSNVSQNDLKSQLQQTKNAILDRVISVFKKHMTCVSDKSNVFDLRSDVWITFASSQRWKMYQFVIGRYKAKYADILSHSSVVEGSWQKSDFHFVYLWKSIQNQLPRLLLRERYLCVEILGLISHLRTIQQAITEEGWQGFTQKYSSNQSVLMESYIINLDNFEEIYNQLKDVYANIKAIEL